MKIKHKVTTTQEEADALFNIAMTACLTVYPSIEEQTAALLIAKKSFKIQLDDLACKAFKIGKKMCYKKADSKDTAAYSNPTDY